MLELLNSAYNENKTTRVHAAGNHARGHDHFIAPRHRNIQAGWKCGVRATHPSCSGSPRNQYPAETLRKHEWFLPDYRPGFAGTCNSARYRPEADALVSIV